VIESLPPDPDGTQALDPERTRAMGTSSKPGPPRFPIEGWDRFEPLAFLGEGGMGRVYKARDLRLNRFVALKFIRGDDAELLDRFRMEARSQALIDHPHVCKVYEVGEEAGHCYIAMQFIEGSPLGQAAEHMSLEEKVRVMQESAEAVHEAHRMGIIHRDLKPANIMVGRDEDGRWWPYIMDFGLARNAEAQGMTLTGVAMGTPAYMPPEQALGRQADIDRRSDVYSLGATLYDLLVGVPPFTAPSITDLLWKVVQEEPLAPRKQMPGLPAELDTIVMKCLEKESARRYDSARALAEDLRRYLDGEPIQARPASLMYRLRKKVKKHRALSVSILISVTVGLGFAGWGASAMLRARHQTQLANRFAMEVQAIEGNMRIAHMRPLHDLSAEKAKVRQRMDRLKENMSELGSVAIGPGGHALGLGHVALGEPEAAKAEFERAWATGYRPPALALALGRTLAGLFEEAQRRAKQLPQEEQEATLRQARKALLDPARELIRKHLPKQEEGRLYLEALLAHLDGDEASAIAKAGEAMAESPGLYEAKQLEAEALMALALARHQAGDAAGARTQVQAARKALATALDLGRSDPQLWTLEADTRAFEAFMLAGRAPLPEVERAYLSSIEACEQALKADPQSAQALHLAAIAWHNLATQQLDQGGDERPALQKAESCLERALAIDPKNPEMWFWMGRVRYAMARAVDHRGESALAAYDRCLEAYATSQRLGRESSERAALAQLFKAQHQASRGEDPLPTLLQAEALARKARQAREDKFSLNTMGLVMNELARTRMAQNQDPLPALKEAGNCFSTGFDRYHAFAALRNLADRWLLEALWLRHSKRSPEPALKEGLQAADEAIRRGPTYFLSHLTRGRLLLLQARLEAIRNAQATVQLARAAFQKAQTLNPNDAQASLDLASLELLQSEPGDPVGLSRAARALEAARTSGGESAEWWSRRAALLERLKQGQEAQRAAQQALRLNPRSSEAMIVLARLARQPNEATAWEEKALAINAMCRDESTPSRGDDRHQHADDQQGAHQ
jgi:tetratricopeptide (TPR) repeat protein/predicted Ser/Thr protein kinase